MKKELFLDDLKKIEIEILDYVVSLCEENGLIYYLDSGTLLGAVRHGGYIPWDDDIDIIMPRKDYRKLIELFDNNGRYRLLSKEINDSYIYPFIKICDSTTELIESEMPRIDGYGVYIDIFPIDGLPDKVSERKKLQGRLWTYRRMWGYATRQKCPKDKLVNKFKYVICKMIGYECLLKQVESIAAAYDMYTTEYAANIVASSDKYRHVKSSVFLESTELNFEGKNYKVPKNYDEYLKILYGDYMQIPPKEKQISNHSFTAYKIL